MNEIEELKATYNRAVDALRDRVTEYNIIKAVPIGGTATMAAVTAAVYDEQVNAIRDAGTAWDLAKIEVDRAERFWAMSLVAYEMHVMQEIVRDKP